MTYQTPITILKTLEAIHRHDLVLPAIQREFVWSNAQICRFYDSLMQGYPFGTFLYWAVSEETSQMFKWYDFVLHYHKKDNPHCPELPPMHRPLTAVLDGQQRLTALNIGLSGSVARKLPRLHITSPWAFPQRFLHLDLLAEPSEEEEIKYTFAFPSDEELRRADASKCWFKVAEIVGMQSGPPMLEWIKSKNLPSDQELRAYKTLDTLYHVVHTNLIVTRYEEESQVIDKVLQIFIRMNSGGTFLSHSDLLLSIAVAQFDELDARQEVYDLVDDLQEIGFSMGKDFVLKAGLMLSSLPVAFKVDNFNRSNMRQLEQNWSKMRQALMLTARLATEVFGFSQDNLSARNALLPIAYYLYKKGFGDDLLTHSSHEDDRKSIKVWLIRTLIKSGIWGSGVDTLLTALREAIDKHGESAFPSEALMRDMAMRGKSVNLEEEEIEALADLQYSDSQVFPMLSFLFPFAQAINGFHVDHIFPRAQVTPSNLRAAGYADETIKPCLDNVNGLANLQLLNANENLEKGGKLPGDWLDGKFPSGSEVARQEYANNRLLGDVPGLEGFEKFYEARREALKERIRTLVAAQ